MKYTTSASFGFAYTIPPTKAANATPSLYHIEAHNVSTGVKTNYEATALTAAVAPTAAVGETPATPGTSGSVSFNTVSLPNDGAYVISVFYATGADLDATSFTKVASGHVQKISAVGSMTV